MGSGQSKLGFGKQKQSYPFPMPVFGPQTGYGGQYPQGFVPQYGLSGYNPLPPPGFAPPQGPQQGFIPPGVFGPGGFVPLQPQQGRPPHRDRRSKKRRSSRRTHSENFVGGFAAEAPPEREQAEHRRAHSESHHRNDGPSMPVPEIPGGPTSRRPSVSNRVPTPFVPTSRRDEEDEEDEDDRHRDIPQPSSRQSNIRFPEPPPIDGNIRNVLQPLDRGNSTSAAYGPPGHRPKTPLKNPLPPPPRDIYDMTPYRAIVNLPHTTALLAGPYGPQSLSFANAAAEMEPPASSKPKRNKSVKGILRAFSKREKEKEKPKETPSRVYVPVFLDPPSGTQRSSQVAQAQVIPNAQGGTTIQVMMPQVQAPPTGQAPAPAPIPQPQVPQPQPDLQRSASHHSRNPSVINAPHPVFPTTPQKNPVFPSGPNDAPLMSASSASSHISGPPRPMMSPVPPTPSVPPPVRFGQYDALNGFLNHSVYRIMYRNKIYPTGLHLHEAMKFIDVHPDIAERIRLCPDVHSVYPLSGQFQHLQRADWPKVYITCMEEVITLKVEQHPDLRTLLMGTGEARIEYTDEHDEFWGVGKGQGQNMLGKVMVRVRERLKHEAA